MSTLIANIVFNSLTHASLTGLRGAVESQQIILQAEDISIHVRVSKPDRERIMLGQLLQGSPGSFIAGARMNLVFGSEKIASTSTNVVGEFRFGAVPTGAMILHAEIPAGPLVIAKFKIIGD